MQLLMIHTNEYHNVKNAHAFDGISYSYAKRQPMPYRLATISFEVERLISLMRGTLAQEAAKITSETLTNQSKAIKAVAENYEV